jgi:hypothetical protein
MLSVVTLNVMALMRVVVVYIKSFYKEVLLNRPILLRKRTCFSSPTVPILSSLSAFRAGKFKAVILAARQRKMLQPLVFSTTTGMLEFAKVSFEFFHFINFHHLIAAPVYCFLVYAGSGQART